MCSWLPAMFVQAKFRQREKQSFSISLSSSIGWGCTGCMVAVGCLTSAEYTSIMEARWSQRMQCVWSQMEWQLFYDHLQYVGIVYTHTLQCGMHVTLSATDTLVCTAKSDYKNITLPVIYPISPAYCCTPPKSCLHVSFHHSQAAKIIMQRLYTKINCRMQIFTPTAQSCGIW